MLPYTITREFPLEFFRDKSRTKVTVYQKTHPHDPDNRQDPIRFKNTLREVTEKLGDDPDRDAILENMASLLEDRTFWNAASAGIAMFLDRENFVIYRLSADVQDIAHVGKHFYLLPLLHYFDALDHAYVLELSKDRYALYTGSRESIEPIALPKEAGTDFYDLFETEREGDLNRGAGGASAHGNRAKAEEEEKDMIRYFRHVDRYLQDALHAHQAVILSGVPSVLDVYRGISKLDILDAVIPVSRQSVDAREYMDRLRDVLSVEDEKRLDGLRRGLEESANRGVVVRDADEIERLVEEGRVETLYISKDLSAFAKEEPELISATNRLTLAVLDKGGHFYVFGHPTLDREHPFAATLRY